MDGRCTCVEHTEKFAVLFTPDSALNEATETLTQCLKLIHDIQRRWQLAKDQSCAAHINSYHT